MKKIVKGVAALLLAMGLVFGAAGTVDATSLGNEVDAPSVMDHHKVRDIPSYPFM